MDTFVLELFDGEGDMCCFYTARWSEASVSETEKFFENHARHDHFRRPLQELARFIAVKIGQEEGALAYFFREENEAHALPPTGTHAVGSVDVNYRDFPLRLYCLRISDRLVVLFNGGEKTSRSAQDGKTGMAFHEACRFAQRIQMALREGDLCIAPDERTLKTRDGSTEITIY